MHTRLFLLLFSFPLVYPIHAFAVSKSQVLPPPPCSKTTTKQRSSSVRQSRGNPFRLPTELQAWPGSPPSSYYLTRIVFLRALAFVYFVAFSVAFRQNKALIGDRGITPARFWLEEARERAAQRREKREQWLQRTFDENGRTSGEKRKNPDAKGLGVWISKGVFRIRKSALFQRTREVLWDRADPMGRPLLTVLWFAKDFSTINPWLDGVALTGMALAALVGTLGAANAPLLLALWICQRSLMAVGGCWYGFGWELQLAELGFHALFLVPLLSLNPISTTPVPFIVVWAIRWHLFRIMLGAGLIKFRSGDKKWRDLTTMNYFYETQPVPSVLTRTMHFMPAAWHKFEVLTNHFVEVVAPFFLILPCPLALLRFGGFLQMQFQTILISTGNLSFLNWLTMVPAIFCLDDAFFRSRFSSMRALEASIAAAVNNPTVSRRVITLMFGALVAWLSVPVVKNLSSKQQTMVSSYDPLRLINSYGAFGVVSETRQEWIIKSAVELDGEWKEYEFKVG
jgi:lipase maturation factor 1